MKNLYLLTFFFLVISCGKKQEPTPAKPTPPVAVTGVIASKITPTTITLEWTSISGVTGYKIYQNLTSNVYYNTTSNTFEITGLTGNTSYTFQVSAINKDGEGPKSTSITVKTTDPPTPPGLVSGFSVKKVTTTAITLEWQAVKDAEGYRVYNNGAKVYEGKDLSFEQVGLKSGTSYSYQISAYNMVGEGTKSTAITAKTETPTPPGLVSGFTVKKVTTTSVTLEWQAVKEAEGYKVYKNSTKIYEGKELSFEDIGLKSGTSYSYQVSAYNSVGEGVKSATLSAKTNNPTLADVVDDPKWVEYLDGKWGFYYKGEGYKFWNWTMAFQLNATSMLYESYSNQYEYISDPQSLDITYLIKIEKDILYTKTFASESFKKYARIEKVSDDEMKVFRISETASSYSESSPDLYTKVNSVEKFSDAVIQSSQLKQAIIGIWGYNASIYTDANFDFTSGKNYYFDNYTYNGAKSSYKYEFKINADNIISVRRWNSDFNPAWERYKVVLESSSVMKWYKLGATGQPSTIASYTLTKK